MRNSSYSWLNTSMTENRVTLNTTELDDFEKVLIDCCPNILDVLNYL